jgi:hypothetical protein
MAEPPSFRREASVTIFMAGSQRYMQLIVLLCQAHARTRARLGTPVSFHLDTNNAVIEDGQDISGTWNQA